MARPSGASETPVRSRLVVVDRVQSQDPPQTPLPEDHPMIQAVAPQRPDQPLNNGFCQGDLGVIGRSRIPIARSRLETCP
jgi:hypothetical protein